MDLLHQAANARHKSGDKTGGQERYLALLAAEPENTEAWIDFGVLLAEGEHLLAAEVTARRAVALDPDAGRPRELLGNVLHRQQRYAEAMVEHDLAVARSPDYVSYGNRALTRYEMGDLDGSVRDFLEALQRTNEAAHIAEIGVDLAYPVLAGGDLRRGFALYEERWCRVAKSQVWDLGIPEWTGVEPLEGKRVLIHQDQGFGDTFHFCRFARELAERGAMVEFAVPATVTRLIEISGLAAAVHDIASPLPQADFHIPVSSLPYRLGITLNQVTSPVYLRAPVSRDLELPVSLFTRSGPHLKIGLAWAARPTHPWAIRRSIPLDWLIDFQAIPGVALYSLQFGPRRTDVQKLGVAGMIYDLSWMIRDWADTAAIIDKLDLVISVDTSVLHLAAAMGKPAIGLLGYPACWRWLRDRDDSPWYHSLILLRQEAPTDWSSVMQRLKAMVTEKAENARLAPSGSNLLSYCADRDPAPNISVAIDPDAPTQEIKRTQKIALPDVTLVAVDAAAHDLVRLAMEDTLAQIDPAAVLLWTDRPDLAHPRAQCFPHPAPPALKEYNRILWYEVPKELHTSHFLVIQWDGWVLNGSAWTDEFLNYDYIGAPWPWHDDCRVGNGGFSLRSAALANFLFANAHQFKVSDQEDDALCRIHRRSLEAKGFKWAPEDLARRFSIEHGEMPPFKPFGFHDCRNWARALHPEKVRQRVGMANEYVGGKPEFRELRKALPPQQSSFGALMGLGEPIESCFENG